MKSIVLIYLLGSTAILLAADVAAEEMKNKRGLRECIRISLNNSRLVKIGTAGEKGKLAEINEYRAAYWPRIFFTARAYRGDVDDSYPSNINAGWVVFDKGKRSFTLRKAEEDHRSSQWRERLVWQETIYRAASAYIRSAQCKEIFILTENVLKDEKRRLEIVKAKSEEGLVPELDVVSVEAEVLQAQILLARARSALKRSGFSLNHAMGLALDEVFEIEEIDYHRWDKSLDEYREINSCLSDRVDYKIAESVLKAAEVDFKRVYVENGPEILLETSYYLPSERNEDFFVGLTLNIPLFEGGLRKARLKKAQAQIEIARLGREELAKSIARQVADAHEQVMSLQQDVRFRKERLSLISQGLEAQKDLYHAGMGDISKLNDAHQNYVNCRLELSRFRGDILLRFILLLKEMGEIENFLFSIPDHRVNRQDNNCQW